MKLGLRLWSYVREEASHGRVMHWHADFFFLSMHLNSRNFVLEFRRKTPRSLRIQTQTKTNSKQMKENYTKEEH